MDFCEQILKLSPYFINNLLFVFPITTFEKVMAKSFEGLKGVWDPAPSQSSVRPFLFLWMIGLFSSPRGGGQNVFKQTLCFFLTCICITQRKPSINQESPMAACRLHMGDLPLLPCNMLWRWTGSLGPVSCGRNGEQTCYCAAGTAQGPSLRAPSPELSLSHLGYF